ncbi:hypothetical protein SBX64_00475 [Vibrio rhizosphaerae]|uniref:Uncharacterized protein n=1 Tax=Vibrio rhizosphaerae TaxID=398736 RepID=A0ABU4INS5_9VIBR|nr:hypothetical protein [Vibrio rhizosphaerae]MDW6091072.1 hypothetical protein [Vibrio rhizosphaerae]
MEFKGYKVIDNVVTQRELSIIIDYLAILRNNKKLKGNTDSESAHMYYAVPYFEAMLSYFRDTVSSVVGEVVYPSYSFLWNYKKGHIVPKHKDRNSVDYIISMNINIAGEDGWDLVIEGESVALKNGQALILDGKKLEHWRDACPYDNRLQLILCYTRDESLLFDGRKHLAFDPIPQVITSPFNSGLEIQDKSVLEAANARV